MPDRVRFVYTDGRHPDGRTVEVGLESAHEVLQSEPSELADEESREIYRDWLGETDAEPEPTQALDTSDVLEGTCGDVRGRMSSIKDADLLRAALETADRVCAEEAITERLAELEE